MGRTVYRPVNPTRAADLAPGMRVERLNADLEFEYLPIEKMVEVKSNGRRVGYKVYVEGYKPGTGQDGSLRPFIVRNAQRVNVLREG